MNAPGTPGIDMALIIAILSFLTSLVTLFVSYLSPAKIKCRFGPTIPIFYDTERTLVDIEEEKPRKRTTKKSDHPLYIYIPTTFVNTGSKTGSVFRISISLYKKENPNQTHSMDWRAFCSYHRETGVWGEDELAHQLSIKGNSTEAKWVSFYWGLKPGILLSEGSYIIHIYYWNEIDSLPQEERHELHISRVNMLDIRANLRGNRNMVELFLDDKKKPNNLTSQREIGNLINEKSKGHVARSTQLAFTSLVLGSISGINLYIVEKFIAQPYHALWWLNPRIVTALLAGLPFILACFFYR
jgi:hypothetical protein